MIQTPIEFVVPYTVKDTSPGLGSGVPDQRLLEVVYAAQTAGNWCWATCAAMLFRYAARANITICQAASTLVTNGNCCTGAPPEGTFNSDWDNPVCNRICTVAEVAQLHAKLGMQSTHRGSAIGLDDVHGEIAGNGRPIEVAFRWFGGGGHVAILLGVDKAGQTVNINDPWPDRGQVVVPFSELVSAYGLGAWFDSWTEIEAAGA